MPFSWLPARSLSHRYTDTISQEEPEWEARSKRPGRYSLKHGKPAICPENEQWTKKHTRGCGSFYMGSESSQNARLLLVSKICMKLHGSTAEMEKFYILLKAVFPSPVQMPFCRHKAHLRSCIELYSNCSKKEKKIFSNKKIYYNFKEHIFRPIHVHGNIYFSK